MKLKRKITIYIISAVFAVCLVAALFTANLNAFAYSDRVEITSNTGDTFKAEDISFEEDESFAFSATINFNSGVAAALTFGETEKGLWAFNIDRNANLVKLLYFTKTDDGYSARELLTERFIGNDKMTQAEKLIVEPKVRQVNKVWLAVVITAQSGGAYIECYADGILRFAYTDGSSAARKIDLNRQFDGFEYEGGNIGYNVCAADVFFDEVRVDDSLNYYTELYRNKFHFSQFAHWNNDPNGLVYYGGYYHLFYQHYPFDSVWGDMYWGHARSKDLLSWENLPICLYPERGGAEGATGAGDGYMWSGCARIYHKGESDVIDGERWFGDTSSYRDGDGVGLIIYYTRDGAKQDQMIASSDDGGLTWTKRRYIPSQQILDLGEAKTDCRDPKVFEYDDNGNTVYGMLLTGMREPFDIWFMRSDNLVDWYAAGGFRAKVPLVNTDATNGPECPDIAFLTADDGNEKAVITLTGRGYIVGDLKYDDGNFIFEVEGKDISQMALEEVPVMQMDFGPDSYATQTFYIEEGIYAGETISVSWFSGVPGASASVNSGLLTSLRDKWNCGMTIPVKWGLHFDGENYLLTQTPITKDSSKYKTVIATAENLAVGAGENILKNVKTTTAEIDAVINNPEGGAVAFRVRAGSNEYTEIGWNETDGYYVDRSHTSSGDYLLPRYAEKYVSGMGDKNRLSFLVILDEGGLEVFCGDGAAAFYTVIFASPVSAGMSLECETAITVEKLEISSFVSTWKYGREENALRVGNDKLEMDLTLSNSKNVTVYGEGVEYEIVSGKGVVTYMETPDGIKVFAEKAGEAVIKATCGENTEYISINAYEGVADTDLKYSEITAGEWYISDEGYTGTISADDAFIFSDRTGADFIYSARFNLKNGVAAALVFRATSDMKNYVIANYDNGAGKVKLWSSAGDDIQVDRRVPDLSDIALTVTARANRVKVYLNQELVIDAELREEAPESGLFGLNVCAATVSFKSVAVTDLSDEKYTNGNIEWNHTDSSAFEIINRTLSNKTVDSGFYTVEGRKIVLSQNYMASLPDAGSYVLEVKGQKSRYQIEIEVESIPSAVWQDRQLQGGNAVFYIGNTSSDTLYINGNAVDKSLYKIDGMYLTVDARAFGYGDNEIKLNDNLRAKVSVNAIPTLEPNFNEGNSTAIYVSLFVIVGAVLVGEGAFIAFILLKKGKKDGSDD